MLNSDKIKSLHPLEFAAEAHLRFVSIHPFRDGNGRNGRLMMNLLLLRAGYPIAIVSNQVRAAYIDAIAQAQQDDSGIHPKSASIGIIHLSLLFLCALCALCGQIIPKPP